MEAFAFLLLGLFSFDEEDKQKHFVAGAATAQITRMVGFTPAQSCMATFGLGIAKELYDSQGHGNVEFMDMAATTAGCAVTFRF